jgi:pimeloyl-ACP methyl ester carboxylesterase
VVRDMEEIRKALKEPRLNFYGGSYGTRIGALYAHHYPETTGRIVLDAPTHPRASYLELVRGQFYALVALHEQLFVQCESGELVCPPDARALFEQVLVNARGRGYEDLFVSAWRQLFGDAGGVQARVNALAQEAADPGGVWIEAFLVGIFGGRGPGPGFSDVVNASVHCTDDVAPPPTLAEAQSVVAEFTSVSPLFAGIAVGAALCAAWPTTPDPVPMPTALDARPVLVIGGTNDMNTPYPWAPAMAEALGNATLLTSTHVGHGAVIRGGDCVKNVVRAYLTSGSLPPFGAVCN